MQTKVCVNYFDISNYDLYAQNHSKEYEAIPRKKMDRTMNLYVVLKEFFF